MKISLGQILISSSALLIAIATVLGFERNPASIGELPLVVRALILDVAVLAALVAVYPFYPIFRQRPGAYALAVCLPALIPALVYFVVLMPQQAGDRLVAEQLSSDLITDGSSNAIVEVGFAFPIYTPTVRVLNPGLYTRQVNLFLRISDADGTPTLYRAVRARVPGSSLSVESSVQGMLSRNDGYLFNPLVLPPGDPVVGRIVFIISNLDEGMNFSDALNAATAANFEIRDPVNGNLIEEFPVDRL